MHEIIHVLQEEQGVFSDYELRTKKHMREMDALVTIIFFSVNMERKYYIAMVSPQNLKQIQKIIYIVNLFYLAIHQLAHNQILFHYPPQRLEFL